MSSESLANTVWPLYYFFENRSTPPIRVISLIFPFFSIFDLRSILAIYCNCESFEIAIVLRGYLGSLSFKILHRITTSYTNTIYPLKVRCRLAAH